MSDRDRQSIRARREEAEVEERERQQPLREAEAQLQQTYRQLQAAQRERLVNPALEDVDVYISSEVAGASMPKSYADEHNIIEWQTFGNAHPEFYPTDHNLSLLIDYHIRNHAEIYPAEMLERVYQRMKDAGVEFDQKPAPEPESNVMKYDRREPANLQPAKVQGPPTYRGWDEDGNEREYTEREVSRWSSSEMKRRLRLTAASGALDLPNVGPGPMTRAQRGEG